MNSRFLVILARINHFEMHLMVLSQKVDSKLLSVARKLKNFDKKKIRMVTNISNIEVAILLSSH